MTKKKINICPEEVLQALSQVGSHIKTARKRRNESQTLLGERINATDVTVREMEKGNPSVSIYSYAMALFAYGLLDGLSKLAHPDNDEIGKTIEINRLPRRSRNRQNRHDF